MGRSVLIVDDEPNIVRSLQFLMSKAGYDVRVARDGEQALDEIARAQPDLVLLDAMMPKRDGFDVCQTIRANPRWAGVRVIMLTAKGRDIEREKGLAMGADDYITKPFSTKEVVVRVEGSWAPRTDLAMNERARKSVTPVRLNALVPLVLATLAGACFLVSAAVLGALTQAKGPIEEHLPRIGSLMLASFGGILLLFSAAWAVLHLWIVRPIRILTGEAETLALTRQGRGLLMPSRHALERLPRAVEQLAQKLAAARAGTAEAVADATQRAEEQKSWLEAILLDLTEGIIVCNLEHRILLYNQAAARILNLRDALGLGRSLFGLLAREPVLQTLELLQQAGHGAGRRGPMRPIARARSRATNSCARPSTSERSSRRA